MIRYAVFANSINAYKDQRTFKTKAWAKREAEKLNEWYMDSFEVVKVEVESEQEKIEKFKNLLSLGNELIEKFNALYANHSGYEFYCDKTEDFLIRFKELNERL